jgi:hypothetical protein
VRRELVAKLIKASAMSAVREVRLHAEKALREVSALAGQCGRVERVERGHEPGEERCVRRVRARDLSEDSLERGVPAAVNRPALERDEGWREESSEVTGVDAEGASEAAGAADRQTPCIGRSCAAEPAERRSGTNERRDPAASVSHQGG